MRNHFQTTRSRRLGVVGLAALAATGIFVGTALAAGPGETKAENWSTIDRNTIGSPVSALRVGPSAIKISNGEVTAPPYGKGSLGLSLADSSTDGSPPSEQATFGNQVDFFGDPVLGITATGFHVFQTGENVSSGGPNNMPSIKFEIDANLTALPADNYTTMVWLPGPSPVVDEWSPYIDATTTGTWFFTGAEGGATGCGSCTFTQAMTALNDGGDAPIIYTVAIGKGRDDRWSGAVDGFRLNTRIYDFEEDGVRHRAAK